MKLTSIPFGEKLSTDFTVAVNGISCELYELRVSAIPFNCVWPGHQRPIEQTETAALLSFAIDGEAQIELVPKKAFKEVMIRPASKNIKPIIDERKIRFTIKEPGQYSVELDGYHKPLFIFANPECDYGISKNDPNVIYFGEGVHKPGLIELTDGQTIYIDQGAVVHGYIRAVKAKNVRILGYGILDGSSALRKDDTILVPHDISRRNPETDIYSPFLKKYPVEEASEIITGSVLLNNKEDFIEFLKDVNMLESTVQIYECENVQISGITIRDSVGFTCIIANCDGVDRDSNSLWQRFFKRHCQRSGAKYTVQKHSSYHR